jgi:hypothetical protein
MAALGRCRSRLIRVEVTGLLDELVVQIEDAYLRSLPTPARKLTKNNKPSSYSFSVVPLEPEELKKAEEEFEERARSFFSSRRRLVPRGNCTAACAGSSTRHELARTRRSSPSTCPRPRTRSFWCGSPQSSRRIKVLVDRGALARRIAVA